jgi:hypothetical protein
VHHFVEGCREYRFMGALGFGGKFWQQSMTVTCYPEDETPERRAIIERANAALADLLAVPVVGGEDKQQ